MRRLRCSIVLAALLGAALVAGGCGSARRAPSRGGSVVSSSGLAPLSATAPTGLAASVVAPTQPATVPQPATEPPPATQPARSNHPAVGTAQQTVSDGARLTVVVERLIDPLTGSGASLLPGTRAVGVLVELANAGPEIYDSSATGDFSLIALPGPVTFLFVPSGICQTPVEDFDRYMTAGVERSGCVAFSVPVSARILAIRFSPHAEAAGSLTWSPG